MYVEISEYLRIIWRRLWILLLVPLLAGGVVAAQVLREPTKYDATATVAAPAVVGGQKAVDQANANLQTFYKRTGLVLPEESYNIKAQEISSLQQRELGARTSGNITGADAVA